MSAAYSNKSVQLLASLPDSACIVVTASLIPRVLVGGGKKSLGTRISHSKGSLSGLNTAQSSQAYNTACEDMVWHALMPNNSGVTTIGAGRAVTPDQNWLNGLPVLKIVTQTVHTV